MTITARGRERAVPRGADVAAAAAGAVENRVRQPARAVDRAASHDHGLPAVRRSGPRCSTCRGTSSPSPRSRSTSTSSRRTSSTRFELHLSDDQGWRIDINSWPRLATYGGALEVGGDARRLLHAEPSTARSSRYAAAHFMTVVPEIDFPGHINAALASYAELNCDGTAPPLYTGTDVGFSSRVRAKAGDVPLPRRRGPRGRGADARAVHQHRRRRGAQHVPADYLTFMTRRWRSCTSTASRCGAGTRRRRRDVDPGLGRGVLGHGRIRRPTMRWRARRSRRASSSCWRRPTTPTSTCSTPPGSRTDRTGRATSACAKSYAWDPATLIPGVSGADVAGCSRRCGRRRCKNIDEVE